MRRRQRENLELRQEGSKEGSRGWEQIQGMEIGRPESGLGCDIQQVRTGSSALRQ